MSKRKPWSRAGTGDAFPLPAANAYPRLMVAGGNENATAGFCVKCLQLRRLRPGDRVRVTIGVEPKEEP